LCTGLVALASGCGSGAGSTAISSQPLSGKVGGQPWTLATAETDSVLSTASLYTVDAYAETFTACTGTASVTANAVFLNFPNAVGNYAVTLDLNQTFYVAATNDNFIATSGEIVISAITATTITGGASFAYDADNSINGQFQATLCP
jgi:hypothetical protein